MTTLAIHICHGIIRSLDAHLARGLLPLDLSDELLIIVSGELAAIASRCPERLADGEMLEAHIASAQGLAALAVEHNRIVTEFAAVADIVPLRLDSFHSGTDSIDRLLATDAPRLWGLLDRIAGRVEFAVRIDRLPVSLAASADQPASGRDYLARRGRDRQRLDALREVQGAQSAAILKALEALSDSVQTAPLPDAATAPRCHMRLALLIRRDAFGAFEREAERLIAAARDAHLAVSVSGPWAPYYFVSGEGA
jgi:hypothetical protein